MYKYILFKPLGIRLKWEVSTSSSNKSVSKEKEARGRRVDIRTLSVVFQYVLEKYMWNLFWIDTI